ncbi:pyridoxal-phosphate dependent enzyme [Hasllibacter sp. MH4015]|uniref:pyridoxal-phosphate dependent enzyme n=1 Tax=Hasllibacter sp. MH4015 TaxID=2854029 RepID=UPI001CD787CF|nr:pyridoxal-phosphate dependent enzyme [Hasllibacter sp. MH4015]
MKPVQNPFRGTGLMLDAPRTRDDARAVSALLAQCPKHAVTPLVDADDVARAANVAHVHIKDERGRMGLGSFKALGAAHAIAREAAKTGKDPMDQALSGRTFVAASAGNHGLSVAAGAAIFGARAIIYLADTVPESFALKLRAKGAEVVRAGAQYEASMNAAAQAARDKGWTLLSDSTWEGYVDPAMDVMEGYLQMAAEAVEQMPEPPTDIFLQAGVGGLAAAFAAHARRAWGDAPRIIVVEPEFAPALIASIQAGRLVTADGPVSDMGRLDCKTPSVVALASLSRDADTFVTISEEQAADGTAQLAGMGFPSTPSGAAGAAALLGRAVDLPQDARVLVVLSEGPEDG